MKRNLIKYLLFGALASMWACGSHDNGKDELSHDHAHHADEHTESTEADAADDDIVLEPEQAEKFGLTVETVSAADFAEVIRVTGQIIDSPVSASVVSAPTSGIVKFAAGMQQGKTVGAGTTVATISGAGMQGGDPNAAARTALEAAKRELDRVTPLHEKGIVSTKNYNAALEAYELAKAQYSPAAASGTAKAVSPGVISDLLVANGQYVEAGTPIATVSASRKLTLRADVPDRYQSSVPLVSNAKVALPYSGEVIDLKDFGGKKVTGATNSRVEPGYVPVYFTFDNGGKALPQTLVDVYLIAAPRQGVITVPVTAISEQQGHKFVYVQLDEECYEKIPVKTGATDGERVEIISGLNGGENVVATGAIAVRLAETAGAVPEGHSHSH